MSAITPNPEYWARVRARAAALGADGCSKSSEWNRDCCLQHDVHVRTGMDVDGQHAVSRREADVIFWACNRQRAQLRLSWLSPRSAIRYAGVRVGAWWARRRRERGRGEQALSDPADSA